MSAAIQEEFIVGEEPTYEEKELVAWAQEAQRKAMATILDSLKQMVTLSTALLAGSAAFFAQLPAQWGWKALAGMWLMGCLGFALWGMFPREATLDVRSPDEIKLAREWATRLRMRHLVRAAICLMLAFATLLAGLVCSPAAK